MRLNDPFKTPIEDEPETRSRPINWAADPGPDNANDAANFLAMYKKQKNSDRIVADLIASPVVTFKAKDILRASGLPALPKDNAHVQLALQLIANGQILDSVYLLRGKLTQGIPVTIVDGYHRVSAAWHTDPSSEVDAHIARP